MGYKRSSMSNAPRVPIPGSVADQVRRDMQRAYRIMEGGRTRDEAAREVGRSPTTLSRYLPLRKEGNRWLLIDAETYGNTKPLPFRVTPTRSERVVVPVPTDGERESANEFGRAVQHYFATGDTSRLQRFEGREIGGLECETRADELDELYWR
jgi:hypothetical protein